MGQAKARGSFEERKAQSIARQQAEEAQRQVEADLAKQRAEVERQHRGAQLKQRAAQVEAARREASAQGVVLVDGRGRVTSTAALVALALSISAARRKT